MPSKTETSRALGFVLSEANGHLSYETVTVVSGTGLLEPGSVLGKVTASSKYAWSQNTGADGSQVADGVLCYPVDATAADVKAVIVKRLAEVKGLELRYHSSVDDSTKRAAKATQLLTQQIIVR